MSHPLKFQVFSIQSLTRLQSTLKTQKETAGSLIQISYLRITVLIIGLPSHYQLGPRFLCLNMKLPGSFLWHTGWHICILHKQQKLLPHMTTSVPSHLTHHAAFLSCPSPTLFWEAEKMKSTKTYIRINLLQAERLSKHLEIHATLHSEGHNSLKYFYSQDSPFLVRMSVLHVSAVTLKNSSTPSGQQHWGHASAEIITASHPAPLPAARQIAGPCPPSPPCSAPSSSHPLASPGTCFPYQCFHSSTARRCSIMCSNREAEACAGCLSM